MKARQQRNITPIAAKISCLLLVGLVLAVAFRPGSVHADGGAPNLAYIAGAQQGVGVVDIAQQKVVKNFAVAGNPYVILLNPDGSLLYVTQPASGQVTALATKTGQVICSAAFPGHPAWLALSVDATTLYVAGMHETTILALDSQTCALQHSFQAPEPVSWLAATGSDTGSALQTRIVARRIYDGEHSK